MNKTTLNSVKRNDYEKKYAEKVSKPEIDDLRRRLEHLEKLAEE